MKRMICTILVLCCCSMTDAQKRIQFIPKKNAIMDRGLANFVDTLKAVANRKDIRKLYTLLDKNIVNGFDDSLNGLKQFKKIWQQNQVSDLWTVLNRLMAFGGQFSTQYETGKKSKSSFVYPYFFDEQ